MEKLQDLFKTGRWKIQKFVLPNAYNYIWDIDNIAEAETELVNAFETNRFFDEATQMIANSICLFQEGFFDTAFYSLRQSIEISIGILYLTANPEKMKEWKALEPGAESGKMAEFLRMHEPVFKDIRTKLSAFFENLRTIQKKTNKYVHKQGFLSFYTTQSYSWSDHRENKAHLKIISDFEETLKAAIGAVAMYRLAIDPLPIILMDEELMMRSGDFITQPYSEDFVNKYIGFKNIELYKQTNLYQGYRESLMVNDKQNEAVYDIIHYQIIDRNKFKDITKQIHLLSYMDRLAVVIMMAPSKIPQVYIEGCLNYTSDVKAKHSDIVIGESYYNNFFCNSEITNYNIPYKQGSFLSRIKINENYSYIESNEPLNNMEIIALRDIEKAFNDEYIKQENEFKEWLKENNIEFNR